MAQRYLFSLCRKAKKTPKSDVDMLSCYEIQDWIGDRSCGNLDNRYHTENNRQCDVAASLQVLPGDSRQEDVQTKEKCWKYGKEIDAGYEDDGFYC